MTEKNRRPPTEFEKRLYEVSEKINTSLCMVEHETPVQVCKRIPEGKVSTYGALAKVLNSSARAVGQASTKSATQNCWCMDQLIESPFNV